MAVRKSTQPVEVTAPAIPADEAFINMIVEAKEAAVTDEQVLQSQRIARVDQMDRDLKRLHAAFDVDLASIDGQIACAKNIQVRADAALEVGRESNVVAIAAE